MGKQVLHFFAIDVLTLYQSVPPSRNPKKFGFPTLKPSFSVFFFILQKERRPYYTLHTCAADAITQAAIALMEYSRLTFRTRCD
jgi:hypothetical protein